MHSRVCGTCSPSCSICLFRVFGEIDLFETAFTHSSAQSKNTNKKKTKRAGTILILGNPNHSLFSPAARLCPFLLAQSLSAFYLPFGKPSLPSTFPASPTMSQTAPRNARSNPNPSQRKKPTEMSKKLLKDFKSSQDYTASKDNNLDEHSIFRYTQGESKFFLFLLSIRMLAVIVYYQDVGCDSLLSGCWL